jgi:hypothetical protein
MSSPYWLVEVILSHSLAKHVCISSALRHVWRFFSHLGHLGTSRGRRTGDGCLLESTNQPKHVLDKQRHRLDLTVSKPAGPFAANTPKMAATAAGIHACMLPRGL